MGVVMSPPLSTGMPRVRHSERTSATVLAATPWQVHPHRMRTLGNEPDIVVDAAKRQCCSSRERPDDVSIPKSRMPVETRVSVIADGSPAPVRARAVGARPDRAVA